MLLKNTTTDENMLRLIEIINEEKDPYLNKLLYLYAKRYIEKKRTK